MSKRNKFKFKSTGKGKTIRPCHVCGEPVNFVLWDSETALRGKRIFHWANTDGSHHYHINHADDMLAAKSHLRSIMQEK